MTDLGVFLEKDFDPKAFINAACAGKPEDQALDRYVSPKIIESCSSSCPPSSHKAQFVCFSITSRFLAELEMKLHLGSEDISLYLQDQAVRATQRIPVAARELARIREDAQGVRSSVSAALTKVQEGSSTHASITSTLTTLEEIDTVKQKMETACSTLKEAAGLSTLFHLVEDLFAAGDLPRAADALAGIRRGLAVVADTVPEFRDGRQRLARLEDRFSAAAEKPLAAALTGQRGGEASALASMLVSIERSDLIVQSYVAVRSAPLRSLWEGYTPGTPFVSWLATFYDQILHSVAAECQWCMTSLPDQYPALVLNLLASFFVEVDKPHRARLAGALTGAQGSLLPLEHLEQAAAAAADFVNGLRQELTVAQAWEDVSGTALLELIVAPMEGAISQYHEKEAPYLAAELPRLLAPVREAAASSPLALPGALSDSVEPAFRAVNAAVARCVHLTGGTSLPALSKVLDRIVMQYISAVQSNCTAVRGPHNTTDKSAVGTISSPEVVLPLLMVVAKIQQQLEQCAAGVAEAATDTIAEILLESTTSTTTSTAAEDSSPTVPVTDPHQPITLKQLRLQSQPALRQHLITFASTTTTTATTTTTTTTTSTTSASAPFPGAASAFEDLSAAVDALAEQALIGRVIQHFSTVPSLPEWQSRPSTSVQLPTFTPYPLQYATAAGEYLMMLPQLLESALASSSSSNGGTLDDRAESNNEGFQQPSTPNVGGANAAVAAQLVADWVDRGALAATLLYLDQLQHIQGLSVQGAGQLAADVEYFSNVLSTLGLAVPPAMAAWQAALMAPDAAALEGLKSLATSEGGSREAVEAVEVVARLRALK